MEEINLAYMGGTIIWGLFFVDTFFVDFHTGSFCFSNEFKESLFERKIKVKQLIVINLNAKVLQKPTPLLKDPCQY